MALSSSVNARSFTTLGSAPISDSKRNTSTNGMTSGLGNGGSFASKNIWGNTAPSSLFSSRDTTRDSSLSRDLTPHVSKHAFRLDSEEFKQSSEALAKSSRPEGLDAWSPWEQRRESINKLSVTTNGSLPSGYPMSNREISPTATRPPAVNLNGTSFGSHGTTYGPPVPVYTKRDRFDVSPGSDSVLSPASGTTSPVERRTQWPLGNHSQPVSQAVSREMSLPPSRHSSIAPAFTMSDYTRAMEATANPRNMSVSSQRNGSVDYFPASNVDPLAGQMTRLNLNMDNRSFNPRQPSISLTTQGLSAASGRAPPFTPISPGGVSLGMKSDEVEDHVRGNSRYSGIDAYTAPQRTSLSSHAGDRNGQRFQPALSTVSFSPGNAFHNGSNYDRSSNYNSTSRSMVDWQDSSNTSLVPRRSSATPDQQVLIDPRFQPMLALQNSYCSMYGLPNPLQFAQASPYMQMVPMGLPGSEAMVAAVDNSFGDNVQSTKLYEFKVAGKNSKRYELKDIYDHIAEFAGDQHGSRFIQTKLETANSDEKERVFREIEPNAIPLMTDVFGNYVIQKFFDHGHQDHKRTLANKMRGQVLNLSLQMYGCRVVQKALEAVLVDQQTALISELEHHVMKCVKDQNGNHVIQKAIERCAPKNIGFIYSAFCNNVNSLSLHPYGCRVIQRCLERDAPSNPSPQKTMILNELHQGMEKGMIADQFGNYVVQHVVQKGGPSDQQHVFDLVLRDLEHFSKHKFASNVVEKCIENSDTFWKRQVIRILVTPDQRRGESESPLVDMIKDNFGNYVIQKLLDNLKQDPQDYMYFHQYLQPAMTHAKRTGCGKQVLSIEKKMHAFTNQQQPHLGYLQLPATPFASNYGSVANTPPPLTNDSQSLPPSLHSSIPSINGDAVEGASLSRKGSEPSNDGMMR